MRILFAHGDKSVKSRYSQALGKYGPVDCFDNGRDAVLAFVNGFQLGNRYDFLVIENDLKQLDGLETVLMIRKFELEHLASYKKALIVFSSEDQHCRSSYEARHGVDARITFQSGPIKLSILECFAEKAAGEIKMKTLPAFARHRLQINTLA